MDSATRRALRQMPDREVFIARLRKFKDYQKWAERRKSKYKDSWSTEEYVKHTNPNDYKQVLNKMENNAKVLRMNRRCYVCGTDDIGILGSMAYMCDADVKKMAKNFGHVTVVTSEIHKGRCPWCNRPAGRIFTVNIYACQKCNWRLSRNADKNRPKKRKKG